MSIKIMSTILEKDIQPIKKLILLCLADSANDEGICWPSIQKLAHKANVKRDSIIRNLKYFEEAGLITKQSRFHKNGRQTSNWYEINVDVLNSLPGHKIFKNQGDKSKAKTIPIDKLGVALELGGSSAGATPQGSAGATPLKRTIINEPSIEINNRAKQALPLSLSIFEQVWSVLPKKKKKKEAQAYWTKHKLHLKAEKILQAAQQYLNYCKTIDPTYIIQAGNWIIKERWEDDLSAGKKNNNSQQRNLVSFFT